MQIKDDLEVHGNRKECNAILEKVLERGKEYNITFRAKNVSLDNPK